MDLKKENEGVFIDDTVEHLETVSDNRVRWFFADWGYGKNKGYQVLNQETWVNYT